MIVYPNAKINIGLNILNRRADGYHEISSIFYPVNSLTDILEIIPSKHFGFSSTGISIPGDTNICVKAYNLLQAEFGIPPVRIHLHKKISIGAGLGGGSSDAAFTLRVLNTLFNLDLSNAQLERYALHLGADCPFFIDNKTKYVTGIGEKMQECHLDLSNYDIRFVFPNLHISTMEAYSNVEPKLPEEDLLNFMSQPVESWKGVVKNDFEDSIFQKYRDLYFMKQDLYSQGAVYASMSGSGSTLYALFKKGV